MQLSLCMVHANGFNFSSNSEDFSIIVLIRFFKSIPDLRAPRDLDCAKPAVWTCFKFIFSCFSNKFSCLGECCKIVLLQSCRNVLWTKEIHLTLHLHGVNTQ